MLEMCAGPEVSHFVRGVECRLEQEVVGENFFGLEESVDFYFCIFNRVRSMNDIFLTAKTEIAADSAGIGFAAVCSACHGSNNLYSIFTFENHNNDRSACH